VKTGVRAAWAGLSAAVALAALGAGGHVAAKAPKFKIADPCTYLTARQVQAAFGGPVTVDPTNRGVPVPRTCDFVTASGGALVAVNSYPGVNPVPGQNAVDEIEVQQAHDSLAGLTLEQVPVGRHAYVDTDRSLIAVAANPKFAFTLSWNPSGGGAGASLTRRDSEHLVSLAKLVIARAPKR
jgi:hypothetical protein